MYLTESITESHMYHITFFRSVLHRKSSEFMGFQQLGSKLIMNFSFSLSLTHLSVFVDSLLDIGLFYFVQFMFILSFLAPLPSGICLKSSFHRICGLPLLICVSFGLHGIRFTVNSSSFCLAIRLPCCHFNSFTCWLIYLTSSSCNLFIPFPDSQ